MHPALLASILLQAVSLQLPCGGPARPYPEIGKPPQVDVWSDQDRAWVPPPCTRWDAPGYTMLVETSGTLRLAGGEEALLRRIGAISSLSGVRYWSTTHGRWQTLIVRAEARTGSDFSPQALATGKDLYFVQEDNLAGNAVYRLRVLECNENRIVFATENVDAVRYWLKTIFHPGDLQSVFFFERLSADVWGYTSLTRMGAGASRLTAGHAASSVNRAVAFYRHYAGIPTDQEPPAAP